MPNIAADRRGREGGASRSAAQGAVRYAPKKVSPGVGLAPAHEPGGNEAGPGKRCRETKADAGRSGHAHETAISWRGGRATKKRPGGRLFAGCLAEGAGFEPAVGY